jgi:hypothetical protein
VERQRLRLEIAFRHVRGQEVMLLILAANQRRPVPRSDRLAQMRWDVADGKSGTYGEFMRTINDL